MSNTSLDLSTAVLSCRADNIRLSTRESDIMWLSLQTGECSLSRVTLLEWIWGCGSDAVESRAEACACFLREKLVSIGSNTHVESIRRLGYRLEVNGGD